MINHRAASMAAFRSLTPSSFFFFFLIPQTLALNFTVNYGTQFKNVKYEGDAYQTEIGIRVTADYNIDNMESIRKVGRATYAEPLHLWDKKSGKMADFSTYFNFLIYADNNTYGDGLCFFLSPVGSTIPDGSSGGGLGLVNSSQIDSNSDDQSFVAVEFDSYMNEWERSVPIPHVGINVNSVSSKTTTQWSNNITSAYYSDAWITYNSSTMTLSVAFNGHPGDDSDGNRTYDNLSYVVDLRNHLPEFVTVGFSASVGDGYQKNKVSNWNFTSSDLPIIVGSTSDNVANNSSTGIVVGKARRRGSLGLGLSLGLALIGLIFVSALVISCYLKKGSSSDEEDDLFGDSIMDDEFEKGSGPKKFSYNELAVSTNKFSEAEKLGEGGFGQVYRGFLTETDSYIAVKRLSGRTHQGLKEYASEVKIISRLRHKNLVQFIGWCHRRGDLLLVYEYMPNGSLDYHLFKRDLIPLSWELRYKIALGLASALLYLHEDYEQCVLHRDIKSSNILLDSSFNAKLGDFGLARLVDHEKGSQTTLVAGTRGYMAPETFTTGRASKESDVYSFGVVLLEIASGKRPVEVTNQQVVTTLIEYAWNLYGMGKLLDAADPKLCNEFDAREMETLMVVGLWCVHPDSNYRPMIKEAKHVLNFDAPLPKIPRMLPQVTYYTPAASGLMLTGSSSGDQTSTDKCSTSLLTTSTSSSLLSPR